jgi:Xaa-Pro aminopeptidase
MVQPNLHFSREEYAQRLAQARRLLVERRLDALLLFARSCT